MYWQRDLETMPRDPLRALQLQRLQDTVSRLEASVPFYQSQFASIPLHRN
jgi:phenylacetate-CoA ligase